MSKRKVYFARLANDKTISLLSELCDVRAWRGEGIAPREILEMEIPDAEAVLGTIPWTAELLDKSPRLRIIANISVGYDNIDPAMATERGILLTNTPDVLTETTADLAFALILMTARRLGEAERLVRAGRWRTINASQDILGTDVHHATLGIVGLGRIGTAVANRAHGFHMRVLYTDNSVRREDLEAQFGYRFVDIDTLLAESDFVSLHLPLTPDRKGMFGTAQFRKMKPSAFLINAARGALVDESALIEALREGRIAGAGLDIYEKEPADPGNPLFSMENVVTMPHIGAATVATRQAICDLAAENVLAVFQGKPPLTPVNPEVFPRMRA